jgi:hypothetical protein
MKDKFFGSIRYKSEAKQRVPGFMIRSRLFLSIPRIELLQAINHLGGDAIFFAKVKAKLGLDWIDWYSRALSSLATSASPFAHI